jgi:flagellar biogenesis protein FliO
MSPDAAVFLLFGLAVVLIIGWVVRRFSRASIDG